MKISSKCLSFSGAATMYTRYKIVEKQNQTSYFCTPVFNLVSLVLGLVGCIGMGIVANFQVWSVAFLVLGTMCEERSRNPSSTLVPGELWNGWWVSKNWMRLIFRSKSLTLGHWSYLILGREGVHVCTIMSVRFQKMLWLLHWSISYWCGLIQGELLSNYIDFTEYEDIYVCLPIPPFGRLHLAFKEQHLISSFCSQSLVSGG